MQEHACCAVISTVVGVAQLSTEMQTDCTHVLSKLFIECLVEKG